ncbi:MAG: Hydrogenase maturation factor HypD [Candidatus Methanohalarchaeum thermophilum]|uniref:Hydrogenase maturation factor HypD n=1 Tax=Methanohalarchaeum thermophilum TaxID=1903181 RepID=A0A1Q6DS46_METT1|nr:MAG: Hydrogenase maturation factor HypD [Candidatus Methanohalarchaeum thermophilum]
MDKKELAQRFSKKIKDLCPEREVRAIHVCGTHEQAITRYGLRSLLPDNFDLKMGPGCPVCVTPARVIDRAIKLARKGLTLATFGDMLNVPGSSSSLSDAKSDGADVKVVYSVNEAIKIAKKIDNDLVFLGVGFETTAPSNAAVLERGVPSNFSILTCHRLIPPAMELLVNLENVNFDGFIAPGHVSTIIGEDPYEKFVSEYDMSTVIAGFEPLDILFAVLKFVKQIDEEIIQLENAYERAVRPEGNIKAKEALNRVFKVVDAEWRGIGEIEDSGLRLKDEYSKFDARKKHDVTLEESRDVHPGCICHLVLTAQKTPKECNLFKEKCTPQNPYGPCMVSEEGECNIWYQYGERPSL